MPRKLKVDPKEVRRAFMGSSQEVIGGHRRPIAGLQGVHKWFIGSSDGVHIPLISVKLLGWRLVFSRGVKSLL